LVVNCVCNFSEHVNIYKYADLTNYCILFCNTDYRKKYSIWHNTRIMWTTFFARWLGPEEHALPTHQQVLSIRFEDNAMQISVLFFFILITGKSDM